MVPSAEAVFDCDPNRRTMNQSVHNPELQFFQKTIKQAYHVCRCVVRLTAEFPFAATLTTCLARNRQGLNSVPVAFDLAIRYTIE